MALRWSGSILSGVTVFVGVAYLHLSWMGLRSVTMCSWSWQNGFHYPVLKHGPRSPTYVRVQRWQTSVRNESDSGWTLMGHNLPAIILRKKGLSVSIYVGTRKMMNYAWIGWSQGKLWWRLVAILTCKSIVKFGYRGERLIESSSSWFPPKFPSG